MLGYKRKYFVKLNSLKHQCKDYTGTNVSLLTQIKQKENKTKLILMTKNEYRPFNNKTALHKINCVQKCQQNKNKAQFS